MKLTPQEVANVMGPRVAQMLRDQTDTTPQVVMFHEEGTVKVLSQTSHRDMVFTDVRFCCVPHCWKDIETQAVSALSSRFGITIIEVVPPSYYEEGILDGLMQALKDLSKGHKKRRKKKNKG